MNELSGTKELIFDTFIEMSSAIGYENVTMRDIAEKVGIKVASIYNHFESKQTILEFVYDFYSRHFYDNRKSVEFMKKLIETASAEEIILAFARTYETEDQKKYVRMILITKIVYMRLYQDSIANAMFAEFYDNDNEHVVTILQYGVEIGRINPDFDLGTFAEILIGTIVMMGIRAFAEIDYKVGQLEQEKRLLAMLTRLLQTALN